MHQTPKNIDNCLAVFQGGGCKAVAYVGAYEAAIQHGVIFSEVAGTSAGSIIAALIAAGATPEKMKEFLNNIDFEKIPTINIKLRFILCISCFVLFFLSTIVFDFYQFKYYLICDLSILIIFVVLLLMLLCPLCKNYGYNRMSNLERILNDELRQLIGRKEKNYIVCFKDLYKPLAIVAADISLFKEDVFTTDKHPNKSVAEAICASCAIPIYFQPYKKQHVDGGLISNSPIHLFAHHPSYHRILSFQLEEKNSSTKDNIKTFINKLISTIVEGATHIQACFGIQVKPIVIPISNISATDFDKLNSTIIDELIKTGKTITAKELESIQNEEITSLHANALNEELKSFDQLYSFIATYSCEHISEVVVSTPDSEWVWHLFPTLLKWVNDNAKINIYLGSSTKNRKTKKCDEDTRQKLLDSLGCKVTRLDTLDANAFFIKANNKWRGAIYKEKFNQDEQFYVFDIGCYYDHTIDSTAMSAWIRKLRENDINIESVFCGNIKLRKTHEDNIINPIRSNCSMYHTADFHYEAINYNDIERFLFLTDKVRLYKYRQIHFLFSLYQNSNISNFGAAEIYMPSNTCTIIGPIIIEKQDGQEYVIEGHTRLLYAYQNKISEIQVLYVSMGTSTIPIKEGFIPRKIQQLVISDNKPHTRNNNPEFRHIEAALRKSRDLMPEQI